MCICERERGCVLSRTLKKDNINYSDKKGAGEGGSNGLHIEWCYSRLHVNRKRNRVYILVYYNFPTYCIARIAGYTR